jgi:hypothetical protein
VAAGGGGGSGGGGSAGAVRAGKAFVEIYANDTALGRGLNAARRKLQAFGSGLRTAGLGMMAGAGAIAAPFVLAFRSIIEEVSKVQDIADRLKATTEAVSALGFAASQTGTDIEAMEKAAVKLRTAAESGDPVLAKLGVDAEKLKDPDLIKVFQEAGRAILKFGEGSEQTAAAVDLLGEKLGPKLIPMLRDLPGLLEEAELSQAIVKTEDAALIESFGDTVDKVISSIRGVFRELLVALLSNKDAIAAWVENTQKALLAVSQWVRQNQGLVTAIALGVTAVGLLGAALTTLGIAVSLIGTAFTGLAVVIGIVKALILALASPVGIIAVAIAAAVAGILTFTDAGRALAANIGGYFSDMAARVKEAGGALVDALSVGRLDLAWKVLTTALELEWVNFTNVMGSTFVEAWYEVVGLVRQMWSDLTTWMVQKLIDVAAAAGPEATGLIGGLVAGMTGQIGLAGAAADLAGLAADPEAAKALVDKAQRERDVAAAKKAREEKAARDQERTDAAKAKVDAAQAARQRARDEQAAAEAARSREEERDRKPLGLGTSVGVFASTVRNFQAAFGAVDVQQLAEQRKTNVLLSRMKWVAY